MKLKTITPIFHVAELPRSLDFYRNVLGFEIAWQFGEPTHIASVCRDSIEIVLLVVPKPVPSSAIIAMDGVNEYFAHIVQRGARELVPLADRPYGMRDGRIADPDGNEISIGESLHHH